MEHQTQNIEKLTIRTLEQIKLEHKIIKHRTLEHKT